MTNNIHKKGEHPVLKTKIAFGQRTADNVTKWVGSWTFLISLSILLVIWILLNIFMVVNRWDPYPFILLNLVLSMLSAYSAPIILMSQNRSAERDRIRANYDYGINRKAEREIQNVQKSLNEIKDMIKRRRKNKK